MMYYERIDISKGIDPINDNKNKECMIYQYCFLIMDSNFKIQYAMVVMI